MSFDTLQVARSLREILTDNGLAELTRWALLNFPASGTAALLPGPEDGKFLLRGEGKPLEVDAKNIGLVRLLPGDVRAQMARNLYRLTDDLPRVPRQELLPISRWGTVYESQRELEDLLKVVQEGIREMKELQGELE